MVVDLGCRLADDDLGPVGADLLGPGGILAVLTHSERIDGRLLDPTGSIVASAQAADLLYLQHVLLLTTGLHPTPPPRSHTPRRTGDHPAAATAEEDLTGRDGVVDVLLFLQPNGHNTNASTEPLHTKAGATRAARTVGRSGRGARPARGGRG